MKPLYTRSVPISHEKFKDLQDLCKKLVIPSEHHNFYSSLVHSKQARDNLDQPDVEENDRDIDNE